MLSRGYGVKGVSGLLRGKVGGFNEIISIKHFDLPEVICLSSCSGTGRSGEIMFLSRDARLRNARHNRGGKTCSLSNFLISITARTIHYSRNKETLVRGVRSRHSGFHGTREEPTVPTVTHNTLPRFWVPCTALVLNLSLSLSYCPVFQPNSGCQLRHRQRGSRVPNSRLWAPHGRTPQKEYPSFASNRMGFPGGSAGKESAYNAARSRFDSCVRKIPWRRDRPPIPAFLGFPSGTDGKESSHSARDLSLIPRLGRCPGGGHGNLLQCSCLENPHVCATIVAWCATIHGVTESRT